MPLKETTDKMSESGSHEPLVDVTQWGKSTAPGASGGGQNSRPEEPSSTSEETTSSPADSSASSSKPASPAPLDIEEVRDTRCSLFGVHLKWLQSCATPGWVLFWLCCGGFFQGLVVNGLVNVVITTIERRYKLKSTESGLIAGGYDVASFIFLIPVSYFGGTRSKPRFIGIGVLVMALGALVFSSPYFLAGRYEYSTEAERLCPVPSNVTWCQNDYSGSHLSNYKYVFFLGQFLHGAGAAPLYTLGVTYLEESVPTRASSVYMGIYYTMALLGPGAGYMMGGQFLKVYVDWMFVDSDDIGLNPSSNIWVGSWWTGFLLGAIFGCLIALPICSFPKVLPGTNKIRAAKVSEVHKKSQNSDAMKKGFGKSVEDLPKSVKILIKNPTFMFLNLAGAMEGLLVSGLASFMPKLLEQQFSMTSSRAALIMGLTTIPGAGGGTFIGGYIVKRYDMKCAAIIKFCVVCAVVSLFLCGTFLISCPTLKFAGKTGHYHQETDANGFIAKCNANCSCSKHQYDPICGRDNVIYYSACHAGCQRVFHFESTRVYANCSCLQGVQTSPSFSKRGLTVEDPETKNKVAVEAVREECVSECQWLPAFLVMIFLCMVFTFLVSMPSLSATLRCVAESQKSFALGIQWIAVRLLGTIPAPFIFGTLIDKSCILWQETCEEGNATGACLFYNNALLSRSFALVCILVKSASFVSFFLALHFYKPPEAVDQPPQNMPIGNDKLKNGNM